MPVVRNKPTSPGRRFTTRIVNVPLHRGSPYKPLLELKKKTGGRNNLGRITVRHKGGGHKRFYRCVDFLRDKDHIIGRIERLEYDPNRSAWIALVLYVDGERRYIIASAKMKVGGEIMSGEDAPISDGNALPLTKVPLGSVVHCIELKPGKGAQMVRSAGTSAQLVARDSGYATVRLRSGEVRKVLDSCRAVLGEVSNSEHMQISLGKAGASRWRGVRPTVRGVVMNPVDHPHGGGEGRTSGGRHPVTPWGKPTKGYRTRRHPNPLVVRYRHKK